MANLQNLKPFTSNQSHEEAVKNGRKGGLKLGENNRKRKLFKEEIEKQLGKSLESIIEATIKQSQKGNIQATQFLRDTIGEKPTDKVENINTELSYEDYIKKVESKDEY